MVDLYRFYQYTSMGEDKRQLELPRLQFVNSLLLTMYDKFLDKPQILWQIINQSSRICEVIIKANIHINKPQNFEIAPFTIISIRNRSQSII